MGESANAKTHHATDVTNYETTPKTERHQARNHPAANAGHPRPSATPTRKGKGIGKVNATGTEAKVCEDIAVYLRRAMDDQSGWMPIETAPHDGIMWVLGYEDDTGETGIIIFDSNPEEEYADEHPDVWTDGYRVWHPSYWMPLPDPPNLVKP